MNAIVAGRELRAAQGEIARLAGPGGRLRAGFVALLDIEMPGGDGLGAAARLHEGLPECRILMLTTFGRPGYFKQAMENGAVGFLTKDAPTGAGP